MVEPTPEMVERGELAKTWASVLGLSDHRFVVEFSSEHDKEGTVTYHQNYPNAAMTLRQGPSTAEKPWPFDDQEETVVHELIHIVMRDASELVERHILPQVPKASRKMSRNLWEHHVERVVEVLARAMVAARRGEIATGKMIVRQVTKDE